MTQNTHAIFKTIGAPEMVSKRCKSMQPEQKYQNKSKHYCFYGKTIVDVKTEITLYSVLINGYMFVDLNTDLNGDLGDNIRSRSKCRFECRFKVRSKWRFSCQFRGQF